MFEVVFTDTQFLVKKSEEKATPNRLAFHDSDLESGLVRLYVRAHWLPYEVVVSFDRLAWKSENVYDMTKRMWQNIDIDMLEEDVVKKDTIRSKNLVMKRFGGPTPDISEFVPYQSYGAQLWSQYWVEETSLIYGHIAYNTSTRGWLYASQQDWKDRTRLLRALSLTNLQMTEWDDIETFDDMQTKCEGNPVKDEDDIQENLQAVRLWQAKNYAEAGKQV